MKSFLSKGEHQSQPNFGLRLSLPKALVPKRHAALPLLFSLWASSPLGNRNRSAVLVLFISSKEPVRRQRQGNLQDLGLSRYQNIFKGMCLNPEFLITSNTPHTKADVCVITFTGSNPNLSHSRGMQGASGKL